jgi:two-component system, OmpR family, phosphate regulon sensor histidine kinase PhoR
MNWTWTVLLLLLAAAVIALAWAYIALKRRIRRYSTRLQTAWEAGQRASALPQDVKGLEQVSNSVKNLAQDFETRAARVEAERARLSAMLEQMTDGVLISDALGRIQFSNPAAGKLFEMRSLLGHTVAEVFRQHQLIEAWQRSQQTGELQTASVERPGRRQFLQLVALPDRQTGGSLLLVQDLTRVRRLETVRRDFVSNISHELRTPLASLKALTETLQQGALEDPKASRRFLERIEVEVDALTQMATELLELSRIESGQVPLELMPMPPQRLLASAVERMRTQAERAGVTLQLEDGLPARPVLADRPRLEQVLVNLIHNAIKFTPTGGRVKLSARDQADFVCFSVEDTGAGIPSDDLERIFERFYKADRARHGGGTGLGLSISRHLVEAHGGRIWAESVEGRGSTFSFTIPAEPAIDPPST